MSGTKKEHVKIILQTIENGTLSETETEQRLLGLVRQEAERKDRPADLGIPLIIAPKPAVSSSAPKISRKSAIQAHCLHAK